MGSPWKGISCPRAAFESLNWAPGKHSRPIKQCIGCQSSCQQLFFLWLFSIAFSLFAQPKQNKTKKKRSLKFTISHAWISRVTCKVILKKVSNLYLHKDELFLSHTVLIECPLKEKAEWWHFFRFSFKKTLFLELKLWTMEEKSK